MFATASNALPILGLYTQRPSQSQGQRIDESWSVHLYNDTVHCLRSVAYSLRHEITRNPLIQAKPKWVGCGDRLDRLGTHIFLTKLVVPSLLKAQLFGNVGGVGGVGVGVGAVRYQTATRILLHVPSATRLMQLFTVEGLHGTACSKTINNQRHHYYACGKVIIKKADNSGGSIRGYIVDQYKTAGNTNKLLIHTVSGSKI